MATDPGKTSNVNAIGILAKERGVSPGEVGATTFRPFYTPVSFGALAGASIGPHFQPLRRSPMHEWAEKNGAQFVETGLWIRSSLFPWAGETHWRQSVDREARTVRETAGLCDVSTLGKIEIFGADAGAFLNRVYCNGFANLPVGKARYRLMLREDGGIVNLSERRAAVAPDSLIGLVWAHVHLSVAAELPEAVRQFCRGLY
jgi:sarcosine oxidase subunit alpha